jgi:DNA-binding winged helix-turn-helix (wHTH) protein/predicted ATPase
MAGAWQFAFGLFRFDARTGQLWRDDSEVRLSPRAAAVLHVLAERSPELVTKLELFDRVWGGMAVSDDALTSCIQELRGALGDDARRPHTIETRHRRGYRLMALVTPIADRSSPAAPLGLVTSEQSRLVGRVAELQELTRAFEYARSARRQVVFVTGEPGIGKSSLADAYLEQLRTERVVRIAHGQCLDHHGVGEPYLPLIETLTRLATGGDGRVVKEILWAQAPSWLAQMPSLWTRSQRNVLEARGQATRERMMRELTLAVEAIASDVPLLLKLEDIHWSDASTLDWIAHIARRPEPARLMLLATFRPADAAAAKVGLGDLVTELTLHGSCREIALSPLTLQAIEAYLRARLIGETQAREIAPLLLERTGGNPLFMTSIVNQLAQREASGRTIGAIMSIPHDVRRFIDRQIDELNENDRNLLTAASVVRREFATAAVAATLEVELEQLETSCARLARQGVFITKSGSTTWPDGSPTELYTFRHDLYRELLYDRLPATRRALSHARVGNRLEGAWTGQLDAIAAELAEHFERAREFARAIPHRQRAAAKALRRSANEEAISHLRRALDAIGHIADEMERTRVEVELRVGIGAAFIASKGFAAPEVLEAYTRAEVLCDRLGEPTDIFPAIWGQWLFRFGRGEFGHARRLCARLLALAEKSGSTILRLQAHHSMWPTLFSCGELTEARAHAEAGLAIYDAPIHQPTASSYGNHDASTCARNFGAMSLVLLGEHQQAREMIDAALAVATHLKDPFSLALTLYFASAAGQMLGDIQLATRNAESSMQVSTEHGLALTMAWSTGVAGWCAAENGDPNRGFALLTEATTALRTMRSLAFMPYLLGLLAEARMKAGHQSEAMQAVKDAIATAESTGECFYSAELYRLHGELLTQPSIGQTEKAENAFRMAIKIAKQQRAVLLERKATTSLRRWIG